MEVAMAENQQTRFTELLCSKLCHDLIGPISAVINGLEIINEEKANELGEEGNKLVQRSANQAAERLAYFRMSLGSAGADDKLQYDVLLDLIKKLASEKELEIGWFGVDNYINSRINKASGKLLLNLVMVAFDCLPRGGQINIKISNDEDKPNLLITLNSNNCVLHNEVEEILENEFSESLLTARNILAAYSKQLALTCSQDITLQEKTRTCVVFKVA